MKNLKGNPNNIFFTSDHHFGHENIIKFCNRPFDNKDHMAKVMREKWNNAVAKNDDVYHLGDLALANSVVPYITGLNGNIKILTLNWHHDREWIRREKEFLSNSGLIEFLPPMEVLQFPNIFPDKRFKITLSHYPMAEWEASHYGCWHFHGNSHDNYHDPMGRPVLDVGVDSHNYTPISLQQIIFIMMKKGYMQSFTYPNSTKGKVLH